MTTDFQIIEIGGTEDPDEAWRSIVPGLVEILVTDIRRRLEAGDLVIRDGWICDKIEAEGETYESIHL